MNNILTATNNARFPVSGRELHERLEIGTDYMRWFTRMCEYGFADGIDFNSRNFAKVQFEGGREVLRDVSDHALSIDMAKHLCMIQRTPKGMEVRKYLINIENQWNTPEAVMERAYIMAKENFAALQGKFKLLTVTNAERHPRQHTAT